MPRASDGRRVWWVAGVLLVVAALLLLRGCEALRPLRRVLTRHVLNPVTSSPAASAPPVEVATLERQLQGQTALVAEAEAGALFPDAPDRVLVLVDQRLVQRLLTALTPSEHVVADRYHVVVTGARVVFEDGFALVRLDGRASLAGVAESDVFADLTVVGDLELPAEQQKRDVLKARIHVLAVDARQVTVGARSEKAEELVEDLGRTKLEDFAALASSLEIPVRQEHEITIPAVGPKGPVRIAAASLPVRLALRSVRAFHGKLWIAMGASIGASSLARNEFALASERGGRSRPPQSPPIAGAVGGGTGGPDLRDLSRDERLLRLHQEYRQRHERLESLLAREPLIQEAERTRGDMVATVPAGLLKEVAQEVARRYFDRVALELSDIEVTKSGEIHADTPVGRVNAGEWTVHVNLLHTRGTLKAKVPRIELKPDDEVDLDLPVLLEEGEGTAALRFAWKSHGLAKVVCKDFETEQEISGRVKPEEYPVEGRFLLTAVKDSLTATPRFDPAFRVKFELDPESWAKVRTALEHQDDITRCGLAFDPDKVFAQLQELVGKGFVIHLPRKLLRTVTLPVGVTESVEVEGRRVAVAVTHNALRITPQGLWYSIDLRPEIQGAPRPGALSSPRP